MQAQNDHSSFDAAMPGTTSLSSITDEVWVSSENRS
jgi:hypothetical protein